MAHSKQALKRVRQSEKKRLRGKSARNEIKTLAKRIVEAVGRKDEAQARALLLQAFSRIDKARKIHILHRNLADRRKSKLARIVNSIGKPGATAAGAAAGGA